VRAAWEEHWRSRTRERLKRELMRRDVGKLASVKHGSWNGMVQAVQELACWRAGVGAGAAGTWAAPSEWREMWEHGDIGPSYATEISDDARVAVSMTRARSLARCTRGNELEGEEVNRE
jgi:hypothetical protein